MASLCKWYKMKDEISRFQSLGTVWGDEEFGCDYKGTFVLMGSFAFCLRQ